MRNKLDQKLENVNVINMLKIFRSFILVLFMMCYVFLFFNASYEFLFNVPEYAEYTSKVFKYSGFLLLFYIVLVLIEASKEAFDDWLKEKAKNL